MLCGFCHCSIISFHCLPLNISKTRRHSTILVPYSLFTSICSAAFDQVVAEYWPALRFGSRGPSLTDGDVDSRYSGDLSFREEKAKFKIP